MGHALFSGVQLFVSCAWQMNSLVVCDPGGPVLFDPGYFPSELREIATFVVSRRIRPRYLVLTHADFDHIVGAPCFPEAEVVAQAGFARRDRTRVLRQIADFDAGLYVERQPPAFFPSPDVTISAPTRLELEEDALLLYPAPGHTPDNLATVLVDRRTLIAGDILSELEFPFVEHSSRAYLASLALVRDLVESGAVTYAVPGHGPPAGYPEEILARVDRDCLYLEGLQNTAREAVARGLSGRAALALFETLTYRGRAIPADLLSNHRKNARLVLKELRQKP